MTSGHVLCGFAEAVVEDAYQASLAEARLWGCLAGGTGMGAMVALQLVQLMLDAEMGVGIARLWPPVVHALLSASLFALALFAHDDVIKHRKVPHVPLTGTRTTSVGYVHYPP